MKLTEAQIEAIQALEDAEGRVTPQQVLDAAKPKNSPLHELFDWDKATAAAKWLLHQARVVLGAVEIHVHTQHSTVKAPYYVVDTSIAGSGYRSVAALKADPANAKESLLYTLEVAAGHLRRAYDISGPLGMSDQIDELIVRITGLKRVIAEEAA